MIKIQSAMDIFARIKEYFSKYADAEQYLDRIDLFDFDHPHHPYNCEVNDPEDLIPGPHNGKINIIVNDNTRGPHITWLVKKLKDGVVYMAAKVIAIDSFFCDFLFQYDEETGQWEHLDTESEAFKKIDRELSLLKKLAQ